MSPASQSQFVQYHLVGAWRRLPIVGLTIAAIILTAIVVLAATGRLSPRIRGSSNVARIGDVDGTAVVVGDLLMIGMASLQAVLESGFGGWGTRYSRRRSPALPTDAERAR